MRSLFDLPISFWGYALLTAAHVLNRTLSKVVDKTPYELWTGKVPKLSFLRIWGCQVYVKHLQPNKLEPRSDKVFFMGYPKETKGSYFYNPSEHKVFVARECVFLEREFLSQKPSGGNIFLKKFKMISPKSLLQWERLFLQWELKFWYLLYLLRWWMSQFVGLVGRVNL